MKKAENHEEAEFRSEISDYQTFLKANQRKTNLLLNKFLGFSVLIGPLLMLAIRAGIFHSVTYTSCKLSMSVGFASPREHPEADIHGLEVFADQMMYREKERYYSIPGIDRRRHIEA